MGMHPMQSPSPCPGADPSPTSRRRSEVTVDGFPSEVTYEMDSLCGARWHVWDKTSPLRRRARPYVEGER